MWTSIVASLRYLPTGQVFAAASLRIDEPGPLRAVPVSAPSSRMFMPDDSSCGAGRFSSAIATSILRMFDSELFSHSAAAPAATTLMAATIPTTARIVLRRECRRPSFV